MGSPRFFAQAYLINQSMYDLSRFAAMLFDTQTELVI